MNNNQDLKTITSSSSKKSYTYSLNERLGSGSFAEVYKGVIDDTQEEIAVKVISKMGIQKYGPDIIKAIGNEVNILQKISTNIRTPYIVKIYECFETQNNIYIILEFCNGKTLADILKASKTLPEKESLVIIYQIILALKVMADHDIAHRDIKPENIFIHNGIYKIGDFGFASQKGLFGTTLGTYPYMAPEIFQNKEYTNKVDVWAVGVMFHEMLFGELYFIGNSHMEVANNVQNKKYILRQPCHLTIETQNLLMKSLEKNPEQRLSANEMLAHKAFELVRNMPDFKEKNEASASCNDALLIKMILENYLKAVKFLETLADRISKYANGGPFLQFYLLNEALKKLAGLNEFFLNEQGPFAQFLNEGRRRIFKKSKFYEEIKKSAEYYLKEFHQKYLLFINYFCNFIQEQWPQEQKSLIMLVKNGVDLNLEELYKEELISRRMVFIRSGDQDYKNSLKDSAKEKLMFAYELSMASEINKLLTEQFDFGTYEIGKNNIDFEELLKQ